MRLHVHYHAFAQNKCTKVCVIVWTILGLYVYDMSEVQVWEVTNLPFHHYRKCVVLAHWLTYSTDFWHTGKKFQQSINEGVRIRI